MSKKEVLTKRMFVASEMIAAGEWSKDTLKTDVIDEILLSLGSDGDGSGWEFGIELVRLTNTRAAMKAKIFSDAWKAFDEAPEIFEVLREFKSDDNDEPRWTQFLLALEAVGWKRVKPELKLAKDQEPKVCTACGK